MPGQNLKPKWAEYFRIDDGTWVALCAQANSSNVTPLDIAIDQKLVDENQFLEIERQKIGLATLKIVFFASEPPLELFKKFDYMKCRQKVCMPIAEWNGNIYWAKLKGETTGFEAPNSQTLWFLAPWSGLKKWFSAWRLMLEPTAATRTDMPAALAAASIPAVVTTHPPIPPPPQSGDAEVSLRVSVPAPAPELETGFAFDFGSGENAGTPSNSQSQSQSFTGTEMRPQGQMPQLEVSLQPQPEILQVELASETLNASTVQPSPTPPISMAPSTMAPLEMSPLPPSPEPAPQIQSFEHTFVEPRAETIMLEDPLDIAPSPAVEVPTVPPPQAEARPSPSLKPTMEETGTQTHQATASIDFSSLLQGEALQPQQAPTEHSKSEPLIMPQSPGQSRAQVPEPQMHETFELAPEISPISPMQDTPSFIIATPTPGPLVPPPVTSDATPPVPSPTIKSAPKVKDIGTISPDQFESRMRLASHQTGAAEILMGTWQNFFDRVMILLYIDGHLVPQWKNAKWQGYHSEGASIALDQPSIFKIVSDTGHPYHGYVRPSATNDQFFKVTANGQYPEHATLIPLIVGDRVLGMVLGLCTKEASTHLVLHKLEEETKLLAATFGKFFSAQAQAS